MPARNINMIKMYFIVKSVIFSYKYTTIFYLNEYVIVKNERKTQIDHPMMSQNNAFFKNNIPSSESDEGAKGYGIVVFEYVTTIPYSGRNNFKNKTTGRNDGIS